MKFIVIINVIIFSNIAYASQCVGRFVNPINDICWSCLFPITIGPVKVNSNNRFDTDDNPDDLICACPKPPFPLPVPGVPIGFWEPVRLIEVTRSPYCMVSMGGLSLGSSFKRSGTVYKAVDEKGFNESFYHVHYYMYPLLYWLELITDFVCLDKTSFDIAYMTEFDPTWNDDELAFIFNPEAVIFSNPVAQAACATDCISTNFSMGIDRLFWCAGCNGSLYPFAGHLTQHRSGIQASHVLSGRLLSKLHRIQVLGITSGRKALCGEVPSARIKKSQYKLQMTYPIPATSGFYACNSLGMNEILFGMGKEFPYKGEDFGYLIWRKKNCCAL
ncbi:MAG: TraU family protein [Sphingobacteriia bacterium]|nr:TraU family protein [Sphingobacteriia bacterium]